MNEPEPHDPSPEIDPEELSIRPVTQQDMLEIRADVSLIKDQLARLLAIAEAPGIAEAARESQKAENARKQEQAYASGELGHYAG
jgi:hypothetical protein